jgi:predicted DNA-binding transcriptional regulator AlpA
MRPMRRALLIYLHYLWPDSKKSAEFWGVSLPHWRRLYRERKVPPPIRVGDRKYGWRVGDLIDGLAERAKGHEP